MSLARRSLAALRIYIDSRSVRPAAEDVDALGKSSTAAAGRLDRLRGAMAAAPRVAMGAAAGVAVLSAGVAALSAASLVQERAEQRLQGAIERSGRSYDAISAQVSAYAAAQQAATRIGDDATLESLARLADLTSGIEASTEQLLGWQALATDVAEATGKSLSEASVLVAKAAAGNVEVIGELIPGMREQARAATAMRDPNERAAFALDALSESFGGAARNIGTTDLALQRIRNGIGDVIEANGKMINANAGVQRALTGVANATDAVAAAMSQATPLGRLFGETVGVFAEFAASRLQSLASQAIRTGHAIGEVSAAIGGSGADAINKRVEAAERAMTLFGQATTTATGATEVQIVSARGLSRALNGLVRERLLEADAAAEIAALYAAGGADQDAARVRMRGLTADLHEQTEAMRFQVGAESELFASRRAGMLQQAEMATMPTAPEAAAAPAVSAGRVRAVEQSAAAVAVVERASAEEERRFRIETDNGMAALFDAHAATMAAKKAAVSAQTLEAQQAFDAKLFVLEDERVRMLQASAAKEAALQVRRQEFNVAAATKLSSVIMAVEGRSAKQRNAALRKALGGELVSEGVALTIKGAANTLAMNPRGPLQIAGGAAMIIGGKALGGGGGGGAGAGGGRSSAPIERMPSESSGPVERNTTVVVNLGASMPRRAVEDMQRSAVRFEGAA